MWLPSIRGVLRGIHGLAFLLFWGTWGLTTNVLAELRMEFPDGTEVRPGRDWRVRVIWEGSSAAWKTLQFTVEAPAALGDVEARSPVELGSGFQLTQTPSLQGARVGVALNGLAMPSGQCLAELLWHLAPELADLTQASVALESISVMASDGNPAVLPSSRQPLRVVSTADVPSILQARLLDLQLFGEPGTLHRLEGSPDAVVWDPFQGETLHSALGWDTPVRIPLTAPGLDTRRFFRAKAQPSVRVPITLAALADSRSVRTRQPFPLGVLVTTASGQAVGAGTVSFWAGSERLGVGVVTNGLCKIQAVAPQEGLFPITIRFSGSALFLPRSEGLEPALRVSDFLEGDDLTDSPAAALPDDGSGWVCVATNGTDPVVGNELKVFRRGSDGALTLARTLPLGGRGIQVLSDTIPASNALFLSANGRWMFAVNAGSDEITVLRMESEGPRLMGRFPSGGPLPDSIAVSHNRVFVSHCGAPGNITGFRLGIDGRLTPIPGSTRFLSNRGQGDSTTPATLQFTPNGRQLILTEADGDAISVFTLGADDTPSEPTIVSVPGTTPTGTAFAKGQFLIVAEAAGDRTGEGTVSSWQMLSSGLAPISPSTATGQTATCWVAVDQTGTSAYFANYEDRNLSRFRVGSDGSLSLAEARAADLGDNGFPTDVAISHDNRWLYVLCDTRNSVIGFRLQTDGTLQRIGEFVGAPKGSVGMVVW